MLIALKYCQFGGKGFRTGQVVPDNILPDSRIRSLISQGFLTKMDEPKVEIETETNLKTPEKLDTKTDTKKQRDTKTDTKKQRRS